MYVASFGPVCWIGSRAGIGSEAVSVAWQPLLRFSMRDNHAASALWWYASIGTKEGLHTARDEERRVHVFWEPLLIHFVKDLTAGAQDAPFIQEESETLE